jgi:hypothetical protein
MPILFWLPIIFMSGLFEIVALPSMPERSKDRRMSRNHQHLSHKDIIVGLEKQSFLEPDRAS